MPHVIPLRPGEPRRIGRYRLAGRIEGPGAALEGSGFAYAATRPDGGMVMVTLLGEGRAADAAARDRFMAEARAARRVAPFCTARIVDAGFEGARPYLVSEFVTGPTLAEAAAAEGRLPEDAVRGVAAGTATGLAAIHQAGLVHGHLGPETVVLSPDGPRVVQFSITPPYGPATPAADILAWARIVLSAAAGPRGPASPRSPGSGTTGPVGRGAGPPEPGSTAGAGYGERDLAALPADLRLVVAECLSPDPPARPTARAVLAELLSSRGASAGLLAEGSRLAQTAARAPTASAPRVAAGRARRGRSAVVLWLAACAACLAAIAAAVLYITRGHGPGGAAPSGRHSTPPAQVPAAMAGRWTGIIRQTHPVLTVTVHLSLGAVAGSVGYPALGCSGTLKVVSAAPSRAVLDQVIVTGRNNCANGRVTLRLTQHGKLTFTFGRRGAAGSPTGTLSRAP